MLFYTTLFLAFLYFKIARIYNKEEAKNKTMLIQNTIVAFAILVLFAYGFTHEVWYMVLLVSYLYFILSALVVAAVQLGVFIDGKPFIKISHLYKSMAFIGMLISFADVYLWGI